MTKDKLLNEINKLSEFIEAYINSKETDISLINIDTELNSLTVSISKLIKKFENEVQKLEKKEQLAQNTAKNLIRLNYNVPGVLYLFELKPDDSYSFPYVSPNAECILGIKSADLINNPDFLMNKIVEKDLSRIISKIKESAATLSPFKEIVEFVLEGENRWMEFLSTPEKQNDGSIIWDGIILDVTERRTVLNALTESEQRYRSVINQAGDAFYFVDFETARILDVNEVSCNLLGYSRNEILNMGVQQIDPLFNDLKKIHSIWESIQYGEAVSFESIHKRKDGTELPVEIRSSIVQLNDKTYMMGFVKDISEQKKVKEQLERTQFTVDKIRDPIYWCARDARIIYVNDSACEQLGYTREELLNMTVLDIDPDFPKDRWDAQWIVTRNRKSYSFETRHQKKNGEIFPVEISVDYIVFENQEFVTTTARDITETKKVNETIKKSENLLKESQKIARLGHYTFDIKTGEWESSQTLDEIFGIDKNYIKDIKGWLKVIHPEHAEEMSDYLLNHVVKNKNPFNYEYRIIRINDKEERWVHGRGELDFNDDGSVKFMIGTIQDITESKIVEQKLIESIKEKDVLLRELYHRTKNNMQVIRSLISLQAASTDNAMVRSTFRDTENRIQAMSLVHQKLYQSQNLSSINLKNYIQELSELVLRSFSIASDRVSLEYNIEDIEILIDIAIPFGLILNELLSNSFKYAFPDNRNGIVKISLSRTDKGEINLGYSDNGIGVPDSFDFSAQETLGLRSIYSIVEHQLQGNVVFNSGSGVSCSIKFSESIYNKRV
ncbi:MAG: PAS domain S-box protein [Melioribacteraceae bacterium]|nr:PAS domain S-box protein [Melioribacteraceae bacterium]